MLTGISHMFTQSAHLYDLIYTQLKDYAAEADAIARLVRERHPTARALLDVACGTGEHALHLATGHGFAVDGVDLDPGLVAIAARKNPRGRYEQGEMSRLELGRRYDVITCLFSAIGYVRTIENLARTAERFRAHLADDGIVLVEPWFPPGVLEHGRITSRVYEADGTTVARMTHCEVIDDRSRLHFDYLVGTRDGITHLRETHECGLFTDEQTRGCFERAGFTVERDDAWIGGRGLYIARPARSSD